MRDSESLVAYQRTAFGGSTRLSAFGLHGLSCLYAWFCPSGCYEDHPLTGVGVQLGVNRRRYYGRLDAAALQVDQAITGIGVHAVSGANTAALTCGEGLGTGRPREKPRVGTDSDVYCHVM